MPTSYNLARMTTSTTGTGTITLGAAATVNGVTYLSFAAAGVPDGATVSYGIADTSNSEVGRGVYTASGTTLTRVPTQSTNSNNAINLSGSAQVFITAVALDLNTATVNAQTGTTYTFVDLDRAKLVTFSNAATIAVTLPQAGASSIFNNGWFCDVANVSTVVTALLTITPTTSTIDGASTLVLNPGRRARIVSDATSSTGNYQVALTGGKQTLPTQQSFLSGSGTYTTPAGCLWIEVIMVGGGGGSAGSGTTGSTNGTAGGNTTFGSSLLTCNGGGGPAAAGFSTGGGGGAVTINSPAVGTAIVGGSGGPALGGSTAIYPSTAAGGQNALGGAGAAGGANSSGGAGQANSGAGGGGPGANNVASTISGAAGGAGGYIRAIIASPAATYAYAVGAAGTAGAAGTSGQAGSAGAAGGIWVIEHYQ